MSRSAPTTTSVPSPIKYYLTFNGEKGVLEYYDKESGKNVTIPKLTLAVLDIRSSVTGWNDNTESKIFSNMIADIQKEVLRIGTAKGKNRTLAVGYWADIKDSVKAAGGNFTVNVIGIAMIKKERCIVNISIYKTGLAAWMDFRNEITPTAIYDQFLTVSEGEHGKKGKVQYIKPKFTLGDTLTDDQIKEAIEYDVKLQEYFKSKTSDNAAGSTDEGEPEVPAERSSHMLPNTAPGDSDAPSMPHTGPFSDEDHDDLPF